MGAVHSKKAAVRGEPGYVWRSGQVRRLKMILAWVRPSGRCLDNGCGLGTYLEALGEHDVQRVGLELEFDRARLAREKSDGLVQGRSERLPFSGDAFDFILSNEVLEHVDDDGRAMAEMVRAVKPGGRIVIFCPNRWYPVEQHGIYWRGTYRFGNIPLVNYLPDVLRDRLAPHVRAYSWRRLRRLVNEQPVRIVHHRRIFGGYDNIEQRWPLAGRVLKRVLYGAERTPLAVLGISHLLVLEKDDSPRL